MLCFLTKLNAGAVAPALGKTTDHAIQKGDEFLRMTNNDEHAMETTRYVRQEMWIELTVYNTDFEGMHNDLMLWNLWRGGSVRDEYIECWRVW